MNITTITIATILVASANPALAQDPVVTPPAVPGADQPAVPTATPAPKMYTPPVSSQTAPMRVEVLTPTSFKDIESGVIYQLYGIDACEPAQVAVSGKQPWACGTVAKAWLILATLNKWVACTPIRQDAAIYVARCATSEYQDIAAEMIKVGYAVMLPGDADRKIPAYLALELSAKNAYRGLWASQFQMPWDFRENPDKAAQK